MHNSERGWTSVYRYRKFCDCLLSEVANEGKREQGTVEWRYQFCNARCNGRTDVAMIGSRQGI